MYINENVKKTERIFPEQGRGNYRRYDMNENPEGLPKEFVDSVLRELTPEYLSTYPEPDRFAGKYADFIGVKPENVLPSNGSDMAIRYLLEVFGEPGKEVVTVSPTFEMYWVNCSLLGLVHKPVPYDDGFTIDVNKIIAAITDDTRVVVLLNPNNPIGTVYTEEEVSAIIARAKEVDALVIIDEAYHYFYEKTFLNHIYDQSGGHANVVILRTFSKLFSLAACRLGVMISDPEIIGYVRQNKLTFDVNSVALKFGERIIENRDMIDGLIESEKAGKKYFNEVLAAHGYETMESKGNFVFLKPNRSPEKLAVLLKEKAGILVKTYGNKNLLAPYMRVSTGSAAAMEFFLNSFFKLDQTE